MNKFFVFLLALVATVSLPAAASAFVANISEPSMPYEVMRMGVNIESQQVYLGDLIGDPHMYEFAVGKENELVLTLVQKKAETDLPLSLIVVKANDNNRGVAEVGRLWGKDVAWQEYFDKSLGLSLKKSQTFKQVIGAGIYKVEVSTPNNYGKYMLVVGTKPLEVGYFETLANIKKTQSFFELSFFRIFISTYVYYPLLCLLVLILLYQTWRKRDKLQAIFENKNHA